MKKRLIAVPMSGIEQSLQPVNPTGNTPAIMPPKNNWWQQSMGVMRVRNGFAVQGLLSLPVPHIDASSASSQRVLSRK